MKAILVCGPTMGPLLAQALARVETQRHQVTIVELQGPPAPPARVDVEHAGMGKTFSSVMLKKFIEPAKEKPTDHIPFYLNLPKYKRKPLKP